MKVILSSVNLNGIVLWKVKFQTHSSMWSNQCSVVTNPVEPSRYGEISLSRASLVRHMSNYCTEIKTYTTLVRDLHEAAQRTHSKDQITCQLLGITAITCLQILTNSGKGLWYTPGVSCQHGNGYQHCKCRQRQLLHTGLSSRRFGRPVN